MVEDTDLIQNILLGIPWVQSILCQVQSLTWRPWYSRTGCANLMKEIFDKRYPVTSFFLLVTALVFLLMLVLTGLNFERADTFKPSLEPCMDRSFACSLSRFGAFSAIFVRYRMGAFHCQYDSPLLSLTTGWGDFRLQAVLPSFFYQEWYTLCFCFHTESCSRQEHPLSWWSGRTENEPRLTACLVVIGVWS